jgi:hypothetical protein
MRKYDILAVMGAEHEGNNLSIDQVLEANTDPNDAGAYLALTALVHITGNPDKKYTLRIEGQQFHDTFVASTADESATEEGTEPEPVLVYPGLITEDALQNLQKLPEGFLKKYLTEQE